MQRWIAMMLLWCVALPLWAVSGTTQVAQVEAGSESTRIFLPLGGPVQHEMLTLSNPPRLVLDLQGAGTPARMLGLPVPGGVVTMVRSGARAPGELRVVLDLTEMPRECQVRLEKNPQGEYRLSVQLNHAPRAVAAVSQPPAKSAALATAQSTPKPPASVPSSTEASAPKKVKESSKAVAATPAPVAVARAATESAAPQAVKSKSSEPTKSVPPPTRVSKPVATSAGPVKNPPVIIAVDAGHGGKDPGAIGGSGAREKDVTLGIARELARRIDREPGMKAVLIRDGDYFLTLRQRIQKARKHQADLFVSVHADAFKDTGSKGSSVYVLSQRGATDEAARWLAARENSADLAGGVKLHDKDEVLAQVLLDLSQTATIDASFLLADRVLGELGRLGPLHKESVQQAGFLVLKSPDIPSILVETAFITNPSEERRLKDPSHQRRIASAIFSGLHAYALERLPYTRLANNAAEDESPLSLAGDPALAP
ncbi:MAG: N-acetylmuramoyl-L-alanine amidase [Candidatus Macondimonas sp.]|jgi:N-acetylmuramoyl-L-alanine amidase